LGIRIEAGEISYDHPRRSGRRSGQRDYSNKEHANPLVNSGVDRRADDAGVTVLSSMGATLRSIPHRACPSVDGCSDGGELISLGRDQVAVESKSISHGQID
jgi:hypothetical protein